MLPHDWPNAMGIYKIYFLDPNLFYIGSAINFRARWSLHCRQLQKGTHGNIHLQRAYARYGPDVLHFEIVEWVEQRENLIAREQYYLDALSPHFNINKNAQSRLGTKLTEEAKAKISAAKKGNSPAPNKGKPISEELRQLLKDLYKDKGIPAGINTRFQKGGIPTNKGKRASLKTRAKIGEANRRRNAVLVLQDITPEQKVQRHKKSRETIRNMPPERKAEIRAKQNATRAANRLVNPPRWARKYDACVECGATTIRHVGRGLCGRCYTRWRRSGSNASE